MRAITFDAFGGPEVLREVDVPAPSPGPGQVVVRVRAAGVNPHDSKIRRGWMKQVFPTILPSTPGSELAGVVDGVGEGVTAVAAGDEVLGWADPRSGAYAERALATKVVRKPADMPWKLAAALPEAGEVAGRVLDSLDLKPGETLIIHGAAGAVGTVAVQLATALGVTVIGTAGPDNQDYVRTLGATPVTYGDGLVDRVRALAPSGVDAAFDVAGKGALEDSIELTGGTNRVVTIADMSAADIGVRFDGGAGDGPSVTRLAELVKVYEQGGLRLTVARTFALEDAAEAQQISEAGHVRGKLVLLIDPDATIPPDDGTRQLALAHPDDPDLRHIAMVGDTYTILISGEDTAGRFAVIDMLVPAGGGPPPHRHDFEEAFHLLDGEIEVTVRGEMSTVRTGETANVPANAPHSFRNATDETVRLLCMVAPSGLEEYFAEVGDPVPGRTSPAPELDDDARAARMQKGLALAAEYRVEIAVPN